MKKLLTFIVSAVLVASCLPRDMQVPQSPLLSTLERKAGLISYIGADGNMYVSDQRIRFEANTGAAARTGVRLHSQLLRLARIVG